MENGFETYRTLMKPNALPNRINTYSVWRYVFKLMGILFFSLLCFLLMGNSDNALSSFIWSSIAFLFITIFSTLLLLREKKWVWFFIFAYLIKVIIGLVHYLYFIDPNYFLSGVYKPLTWEYDGAFNQILTSAHDKINHNNIFYYEFYEGGVTHQEISSIISIPFMFFGDYMMTIAPINSFASLIVSMNLLLISRHKFNYNVKNLNSIALVSAYFPITLITSLVYRDIVGLSLMSIGLALILFSKRPITQFIMLIVACYFFYLQRTIYPLILIVAFIINAMIQQNHKSKSREFFYKIATITLTIVLIPIIITYSNTEVNQNMFSSGLNINLSILPIKMIVGLIGPFPWSNFLLYKTFPAYAYQIQDYLQGTLNIAILITIILSWKKYVRKDQINILNITGILLVVAGLFNAYMHMSYVAIGFILLIPWLFTHISISRLNKHYIFSFLTLLLLNFFVLAFFGNIGISSLWK